ncbi:L-cysteine:1D-myo-inositol 2-amino-2-deoxy-alpha-D-glucopyranoside ligase [Microlunatus endophyticus]|uniref:L-cysteine:1D-myo-inositol 2-amino-2-deoxy-alpha-D-glucopyranoside ligase n=1 Tax=Microlunatus endophyticus TaxID=1716077 RepID=A0A917S115_9ACTN|nr:cysteine--1-D-myo-inosityl 2-amino-2-deoxy-alpha-D-glucopyranoside ligase [Microlunatus endophyticus]GGL49365.1 L-cysteine:1D-myo-inositol 2-amino-2-deoxy-alpha-D-glucopyranoside ligase [Microlunatus endophyticus]
MLAWKATSIPSAARHDGEGHALTIFDSAAGQVVDLGPEDGTARMYVCGITPYDATHMGHANTYVTFDLLNRVWRDHGLAVNYTQNVTDVDDPLLERADQTGVDWRQLAADQIQLFREDMEALNVIPPDAYVGAVESIDLVVELIERLQQRGAIYAVGDPDYPDLYFRRKSDDEFGSVGHLDGTEALEIFAERGGDPARPGKEDPLDCLVWRLERPGEPAWDSPFGRGRPGWHIECTAISLKELGPGFDVQGGGSDLIFPHHEMCAAEGRVATGEDFARAYVHGGMVGLDGEKMSKSLGNLVLVSQLRAQGVDPMAIRLALLANRYRADWFWTADLLTAAQARLERWREAARLSAALPAADVIAQLRTALNNDLDAPAALAVVDAWASGSLDIDSDDAEAPGQVAQAVDALLGVRL